MGRRRPTPGRVIVRDLSVRLTDDERAERSARLTETLSKREDVDGLRKDAAASYRAQLEELDDIVRDLVIDLRAGCETRPVECREEFDFARGMARVVRTDTGEVVDSRPLTDEERQLDLRSITAEPEVGE